MSRPRYRLRRAPALLAVGIFVIAAGTILIATASQTTTVVVNQDLSEYWRTTYDILVRPPGSRSPIEEKYDLVEGNFLSGILGGITFEQYETIKAIPGIEVAAPVATLVIYRPTLVPFTSISDIVFVPRDLGVYILETLTDFDEGIRIRHEENSIYFFNGPVPSGLELDNGTYIEDIRVNFSGAAIGGSRILDLLLVAIEPSQEAALFGLDQAVVDGEYLSGNEPMEIGVPLGPEQDSNIITFAPDSKLKVNNVPILINADLYIRFTQRGRIYRVVLPDDISTIDDILERGGISYLSTLPKEVIIEQLIDSDALYPEFIENLKKDQPYGGSFPGLGVVPRTYREVSPPFSYNGIVLETDLHQELIAFPAVFTIQVKGVYDIERILKQEDVNRLPLGTYFPPTAILRYDENGQPLEPLEFRPADKAEYYIPSPPLMLTTMQAARALLGDDAAAISAIRIRVAGIDELNAAAQSKIEAIAGEIERLTGLDVDIMVGSSPARMLIHVPGVGYVEEQWIAKNVTTTYKQRVQLGHLLLLGTLLGVGGLFTLDLTWAHVVTQRRTIALKKAVGWRSSTIFRQVLGQILLVGSMAAALGALAAYLAARSAGWELPSYSLLILAPILIAGLCLVGGAYPAWLAARVPPLVGLQRGNIRYQRKGLKVVLVSDLWRYAWQGLMRRWTRTALGSLTVMLSASILVIMLAVTFDRQRVLSGTLLGEFVLVHIEGYHYAIVAISFGLAALSLVNSLLTAVLERRREIGVLKAVGWRTGTIAQLFLAEGVLLGALGGLAGAALGLGVFVGLYESISPNLAWIGLIGVGVSVAVSLLATLYPSLVAAQVPPGEAVRYE